MSTLIFLDTGVVGKLIHPLVDQSKTRLAQNAQSEVKESIREAIECTEWLETLINEGYRVVISEIVNYEARREHIRRIRNSYVAYDADLIIAAQAVIIKRIGIDVIIATTDTEDFNRLLQQHHIEARRWRDIKP